MNIVYQLLLKFFNEEKINFAISYFVNKEIRTRSRNFISNFYNKYVAKK